MAKTIISYVATAIVGAALTLLLWPKKTVTVEIPPRESRIDSLAVAKYELWKKDNAKVFATRDDIRSSAKDVSDEFNYSIYCFSVFSANHYLCVAAAPSESLHVVQGHKHRVVRLYHQR